MVGQGLAAPLLVFGRVRFVVLGCPLPARFASNPQRYQQHHPPFPRLFQNQHGEGRAGTIDRRGLHFYFYTTNTCTISSEALLFVF